MLQPLCGKLAALNMIAVLITGCGGPTVAPDAFTGPEAPPGARRSPQFKDLPLILTITTDKESYRIGDDIRLTVELRNPTAQPITFFDSGAWRQLDLYPSGEVGGRLFVEQFRTTGYVRYPRPDGREEYLDTCISGGPVSQDTGDAVFTTIEAGGVLREVVTIQAKVAGSWDVDTCLGSDQNYLVRGHFPGPHGTFRFKSALSRPVAEQPQPPVRPRPNGWWYNSAAECDQKVELRTTLGGTRAPTIVLKVVDH